MRKDWIERLNARIWRDIAAMPPGVRAGLYHSTRPPWYPMTRVPIFKNVMDELAIRANAEPGRLVKFLTPKQRKEIRGRYLHVAQANRWTMIRIPIPYTHELRTEIDPNGPTAHVPLATCYSWLYYATLTSEEYEARELRQLPAWKEHVELIHDMELMIRAFVGEEGHERLIQAIKAELGPARKTARAV